MVKIKTQEQILKEYEQKSEILLRKMMQVLIRAQRKVDDGAYRQALANLENIQNHKKS